LFFLYCYLFLDSNRWWLSSTGHVVILHGGWLPHHLPLTLIVEARWLSSKSLENTCSGAKNSRMG
jgi:hypothetical protein